MSLSINDIKFNNEQLKKSKKSGINNSKEIVKYYSDNYLNNRTLTAKLSVAKRFFMENGYDKRFVVHLYPDKNITKQVIKDNQNVLEKTRFIQIKKSYVDNIINNYPNEKNSYLKLSIYLLLSSGRRLSEILSSEYSADPEKRNFVIVDKLLKKRDDSKNFSIRIIGNRNIFLEAMKTFKDLTSEFKPMTIQQGIQKYIRHNYSSVGLKTSHFFRVLYANYLVKYENPDNILYNIYLKEALNHNNYLTSINYSSINVVDG